MGFYERAQEHLAPLLDQSLSSAKGLHDRLRAVIQVKLEYFAADRKLLRPFPPTSIPTILFLRSVKKLATFATATSDFSPKPSRVGKYMSPKT